MKFPDDFKSVPHPVVQGATSWRATKPNGKEVSIVGGGYGLYGDGVTTFEMWDMDEEEPQGYLSKEEINKHLASIE